MQLLIGVVQIFIADFLINWSEFQQWTFFTADIMTSHWKSTDDAEFVHCFFSHKVPLLAKTESKNLSAGSQK